MISCSQSRGPSRSTSSLRLFDAYQSSEREEETSQLNDDIPSERGTYGIVETPEARLLPMLNQDVRNAVVIDNAGTILVYSGNNIFIQDIRQARWIDYTFDPDTIPFRTGHTAVAVGDHKVLIHSGVTTLDDRDKSLSYFDYSTGQWIPVKLPRHSPVPPERRYHAACLTPDGSRMIIAGGKLINAPGGREIVCSDLYIYDLLQECWEGPYEFFPRTNHTLTVYGDRVYCFGGEVRRKFPWRSTEIMYFDLNTKKAGIKMSHIGPGFPSFSAEYRSQTFVRVSEDIMAAAVMYDETQPAGSATRSSGSGGTGQSVAASPFLFFYHFAVGEWLAAEGGAAGQLAPVGYVFHGGVYHGGVLRLLGRQSSVRQVLEYSPYRYFFKLRALGIEGGRSNEGSNGCTQEEIRRTFLVKSSIQRAKSFQCNATASWTDQLYQQYLEGRWTDFSITGVVAEPRGNLGTPGIPGTTGSAVVSEPIRVHSLILLTRWSFFRCAFEAQMVESQRKTLHIPEDVQWLKALVRYLYTDSLAGIAKPTVAGILVLATIYDLPELRDLCLGNLVTDVEWLSPSDLLETWCNVYEADIEFLRALYVTIIRDRFKEVKECEYFRGLDGSWRESLQEEMEKYTYCRQLLVAE